MSDPFSKSFPMCTRFPIVRQTLHAYMRRVNQRSRLHVYVLFLRMFSDSGMEILMIFTIFSESYTTIFSHKDGFGVPVSGTFSLAWTISTSTVSNGSSTTFRLIENIFGLSKSLVQSGHA